MGFAPRSDDLLRQENTDRVGQLAVGGDVEDVFVRVGFTGVGFCGWTLSDEVVLVNVALRSGIGFDSADGHRMVVGRWSLVVRGAGTNAASGDSEEAPGKRIKISARKSTSIGTANDKRLATSDCLLPAAIPRRHHPPVLTRARDAVEHAPSGERDIADRFFSVTLATQVGRHDAENIRTLVYEDHARVVAHAFERAGLVGDLQIFGKIARDPTV